MHKTGLVRYHLRGNLIARTLLCPLLCPAPNRSYMKFVRICRFLECMIQTHQLIFIYLYFFCFLHLSNKNPNSFVEAFRGSHSTHIFRHSCAGPGHLGQHAVRGVCRSTRGERETRQQGITRPLLCPKKTTINCEMLRSPEEEETALVEVM